MKPILLSSIIFCSVAVSAQETVDTMSAPKAKENRFTVDVNLLTRGELRNGGLSNTENDDQTAAFVIERTLLGMEYERPGLSARVTAQHSGTWGSKETNSFNLYEAWARLQSKKGLFVQIGRQNLNYDDQRIFGADNWAMTAMSHDALKIGYEGHGHKIHIIGSYNQNIGNMNGGHYFAGGLQPYKAMEALWYHYDVPKIPLGASLLFMNVGVQNSEYAADTTTYQEQLVGAYVKYHPRRLTAELAFYYQFGTENNGLPVDAWMASAKASYDINPSLTLYGGYDYLSGDKNFAVPPHGHFGMTQHRKVKGFSSLYGSHHKFYGAMDFFYVTTYVGGFTPGLQNLYVGGRWIPVKRLSTDISYHYLATAAKLIDNNRSLGHELEIALRYNLMKDVSIGAGYSYMRGTDTMAALKRAVDDDRELHWGWIMLTVSPKIFTTMW